MGVGRSGYFFTFGIGVGVESVQKPGSGNGVVFFPVLEWESESESNRFGNQIRSRELESIRKYVSASLNGQ